MLKLAATLALLPGAVAAECPLALLLALDVSASVDSREYQLQAEGTAAALLSTPVRQALLADPRSPVMIAAFVWSGVDHQAPVADWTPIDSAAALQAFAARIAVFPRPPTDGRTATGAALAHAATLFAAGPACDRRTLDVSTDGKSNDGPDPAQVRLRDAFDGITINGLAVAGDQPLDHEPWRPEGELSAYMRLNVVRGPDAFVESAADYRDFERAMTRKLLREIGTLTLGALD